MYMTLGANGLYGWLLSQFNGSVFTNNSGLGFDPGKGKFNSLERGDLAEKKRAMKFLVIMTITISILILLRGGWGIWCGQGSDISFERSWDWVDCGLGQKMGFFHVRRMGSGGEVGPNIVFKGLIGMGRDRFQWRPSRYDADQLLSGRFVRLHPSIAVSLGLAVSPSRRLDWFNDNRLIIPVILNISKCCSQELCMIGEFRAQSFWVMSDLGMPGRLASWWLTYYMITSVVKSAQENSGLSDGYLGSLGTNADIWKLMELDLAHVKVWVAKKCLHQFFVAEWKTHLMRPIVFCVRSSNSCRVHLYRLIIFVLYIGSNRDYPRVIVRLQFRPFLFFWGVDSTLRITQDAGGDQSVAATAM
ncbi:hypothetical protein L1987_64208 [Smallanthus sonchifolius]|uniref:Uncharacterized protein n=1 Tax=Smallanthus sonchifolius TaxID=185202 RepID=A0ACB9CFE6_9ASTR|nr:hypothetical protein L1987_64208 [Smallanthus sonchifolius]